MPDTAGIVRGRLDSDGMHMSNSPALYGAVETALPHLWQWLEESTPAGIDPAPDFLVAHPGGPRVMQVLLDGLKCRPDLMETSRQSLVHHGNMGSVSVLDVLARTHATPPPSGARGLVLGVGPGVTMTACTATWQ